MAELRHDRFRPGQRPVPVRAAVLGLLAELPVTVRVPVTAPATVGRKLTDRSQDLPAASVAGATGQLPRVTVNLAVLVVTVPMVNGALPVLDNRTDCVRTVPTRRRPKWVVAGR